MGQFCANITEKVGGQKDSFDHEFWQRAIFGILATLSIIGLIVVAISIFLNKKLSGHPSPLIAKICLAEAIMCWNAFARFIKPKNVVCYFRTYQVLKATIQ